MARFIAFIAVTLFCTALQYVACEDPVTLIIDTPEKYEQLKFGHFNHEYRYRYVEITSAAHPQVLSLPQYFGGAVFPVLTFTSIEADGNNTITIFPQLRSARIHFTTGANPLSAVPKQYSEYSINYTYPATPTTENIDSILQWTEAEKLDISDKDGVAVNLYKRIDELSKLKKLWLLSLYVQDNTYEQIKVTTFMDNLMGLLVLDFTGNHMTDEQMKEFEFKNKIPSSWRGLWMGQTKISYRKQ